EHPAGSANPPRIPLENDRFLNFVHREAPRRSDPAKLRDVIGDIFQPTHLLFILVIALLVLGPKRLPEVGRSLGRGIRDFRQAMSSDEPHDEVVASTSAPATKSVAEPAKEPAERLG